MIPIIFLTLLKIQKIFIMKRINALLYKSLLLAFVISLSACKGKTQDNNASSQPSEETSAVTTIPVTKLADGKVKDMDSKMFNERIVNLDKNNHQYLSSIPSVIDCYATWCGPCKQLAPIMDELATEYKGKVAFYRVDVEKEPSFTMDLNVSAMPTIFFVNKKGAKNVVGFRSKEELKKSIEELLKQ